MTRDLVGTSLERYQVQAVLGEGGMAVVYRARDAWLGRPVALKVLKPDLERDATAARHFLEDARTAAQFNHPNIVTVYDFRRIDGRSVIAMELLEGESLATLLRRVGRLNGTQAVAIARQVAIALDYIHDRGFVHCDIKPANVLLTRSGRAVISDFGIARSLRMRQHSQDGLIAGTLAYMSPEQIAGRPVGPASDVYSLGVVTYRMLTGESPFSADGTYALMNQVAYDDPVPPRQLNRGISASVEKAILGALDKDPGRRPQRASEFTASLGRRNVPWPLVAAAATILTVILVALGVHYFKTKPEREARATAVAAANATATQQVATAVAIAERRAAPLLATDARADGDVQATVEGLVAAARLAAGATADAAVEATVEAFQLARVHTPTSTARPAATATTGATGPTAPVPPAPSATLPEHGSRESGLVNFAWSYDGRLAANEVFDVKVCAGAGCSPAEGVTNTKDLRYAWCPEDGEGTYRWVVQVIDDGPGHPPAGPPSAIRDFTWTNGPECSRPARPDQSAPTIEPLPKRTPPQG